MIVLILLIVIRQKKNEAQIPIIILAHIITPAVVDTRAVQYRETVLPARQ